MMPIITYSPAFTLVPTYECINRCTYCNFRQDLGTGSRLSLAEAREMLTGLRGQGICEILILAGEVALNSPQRPAWVEHIYQLAELALNLGFLPHTNAGVLTAPELADLARVNVSQGLMLEQVTPRLLETVHRHAPTKEPTLRLNHLIQAGRLGIPCTTGLLLGIGETAQERIETLQAIATLQAQWGHIQEVILQPYSPSPAQPIPNLGFETGQLPELIHQAREMLPPEITIQIPPNLMPNVELLLACLEAGARDLGGLVPHDHVNPDYPHHDFAQLQDSLAQAGYKLHPRLPIYPQFFKRISPQFRGLVAQWQNYFQDQAASPQFVGK